MNSNEIYIKKLEDLLAEEQKARDFYKYYADQIQDPVLIEILKIIYEDEIRHMVVVQNFIKIISG